MIPAAVRVAVRNAAGGSGPFTVRQIDDLFESHGFLERGEGVPDVGGVRRTAIEEFHARIDWTSAEQARRYLELVSDVLDHYPEDEDRPASAGHTLRKALGRAGLVAPDGGLRLPGDPTSAISAPRHADRVWVPGRPRVFISHIHDVRRDVAELAEGLESYGCCSFVAHDQIEASRDWREAIEGALSTCDILVAYVTPGFSESRWTDQEVGWALGRGIPIVPINAGLQPYGFFGAYQSIMGIGRQPYSLAADVFGAIATACFTGQRPRSSSLAPAVAQAAVAAFCSSRSFDSTRARFPLLKLVPSNLWTDSMVQDVERAATDNRQISEAVIPGQPPTRVPDGVHVLLATLRR